MTQETENTMEKTWLKQYPQGVPANINVELPEAVRDRRSTARCSWLPSSCSL
ncbi:MAG: hypothetical protein HC937_01205 [Aquincola sp.]|nr:hypothetical protein [Aquincola sp.]